MNQLIKIGIIIIIGWGLFFNMAFIFSFDKKYPEKCDLTAIAKVVSMKKEKQNSNCYTVKITKADRKSLKNTKIILYTTKEKNFKYGDIVQILGSFSKGDVARNYKGFSYRNYLKQSKIYGSLYGKEVKVLGHENGLVEKIYCLKDKLYQTLDQIYEENTNAFLKGILLGDSSMLDDEIKESFKQSSMSHVLAISGMHVSYVIFGVQVILDKFINSRKLKNYLILVILAFFVIITGGAPSCLRACIMSGMLFISQNFYRKNNVYASIVFTFIMLLFMNPYHIFAVGMWLSFGGTLGIILFHQFLKRFIECKFKLKSKFIKAFMEVFLVSFAAQILIVPIMIYCFNTISLTFFVSNLLIYFLVGPMLGLGYISLIVGMFFLPIGKVIAILEDFFVMILFKIAEFCSRLPFSKIYLATPDFWMIILYYVVVTSLVWLFSKKKIRFLRFILSNEIAEISQKYWRKILACITLILILFGTLKSIPQDLKIYFVDVGQR